MSNLPVTPLVIFYNGVLFNDPATETLGIEARPVYDSSGRAVKYVLYKITIKTTLAAGNQQQGQTTDATLQTLRKRLSAPGGEFHYEAVGYGDLVVNIPPAGPTVGKNSTAKDAIWGPKPEVLAWKPLGQSAADVTWSVQVAIPECDLATYAFATMEYVFRLEVEISESGYSTRTYSGHVSIPQTRATVDARTLSDTADRLLERVNPPLLPGFRRIRGTTTLSEDKCKLDFSIQDVEIGPNYPPPGVVEVNFAHSVSTDNWFGGLWNGIFRGTYQLARNVPRTLALEHFRSVVADRIERAPSVSWLNEKREPQRGFALISRWDIAEPEIYCKGDTKQASLSVTYTLAAEFKQVVKGSGLWAPVPNSDWQQWSQSLAGTAFHVRGNARLRFDPSQDAIIDLCAQSQTALRAGGGPPDQPSRDTGRLFRNRTPPPGTSWLVYWSILWLEIIDETIEMKLLPASPVSPPNPYANSPGLQGNAMQPAIPGLDAALGSFATRVPHRSFNRGASSPGFGGGGAPSAVVQTRARPTVYLHLSGFAIRAGYTITPPEVVRLGNATLIPANLPGRAFEHWIMVTWFGVPIVGCRWHLRYLVSGNLPGVPLPATP